jgi:hypothetical protein
LHSIATSFLFQILSKDNGPKKLSKTDLNRSVEFSRGLPPSSDGVTMVKHPNGMKPKVSERKQVAGKQKIAPPTHYNRIARRHGHSKEDWVCAGYKYNPIVKRIRDLWEVQYQPAAELTQQGNYQVNSQH